MTGYDVPAFDAGYPGDAVPVPPPGRTPATVLRAAGGAGGTGHAGDAGHVADTVLAQAVYEGCGGFMMGTLEVALPMGALREVVPLTPLHCVPSKAHGLIGAIDLRGVMLPVLDLRLTLCRNSNDARFPCVVIMVHEGRLLGLLADDVTGVFRVADGSFKRMHVSGGALPLLAGSLRRADDDRLVNLLSPQALATLPEMPMVEDPEPERSHHGSGAGQAQAAPTAVPMMLMRSGPLVLCIDAMAVHATLSAPVIERSVLAMGACRGVVPYQGERVPVVDLLEHLGLGRLPEGGMRELLLLHCGPGLVGLLMERVIDVVGVARDAVVPVPAFALPRPALFSGALPLDALPAALRDELRGAGGAAQCLVLDDTGLRQDEPLCALASTQTPVGQAQAAAVVGALGLTTGGDGALAARRAMVTFELAGEAAVPIEQLAEILPYRTADAAASPAGTGGGALVGLVVDRGRSIPVLDLPRLAAVGQLAPGIDASVLVVQAGEAWLGFAVPRLRAIEPADWEPSLPSHGLGEADALTHTLRSRTLAQVGQGAEQRMLRVLDLGAIAQALQSQRLAA
ncbi:chemotaxis protein CheW [Ideonella sp. DXS22W]|uniref:Chemotaxis protein CheW n=1 Tax=Pseudaquabacterium inlustre TaxID=2984192 RepID=A0ABU9CAQ4_9BURK